MTETMELPTVTLGGKSWRVPPLAIKQLRHTRQKIIAVTNTISATETESFGDRVMSLTEEEYGDLLDVVYWGLTRAEPTLTRDAFDALSASDIEILSAFFVIRTQSGLYVQAKPGEEIPGEATAESETTASQTGT